MKKLCTLFLFLITLTGCSLRYQKEVKFSDYIYSSEDERAEIVQNSSTQTFHFKADNFPKNCEWRELDRIVDGDTIWITDPAEKVRFIGIDTPETKHPNKAFNPKGLAASDHLKELLKDETQICLIRDSIGDQRDKYDRVLAYIFTKNGVDINAEMISSGHAAWYRSFPYERKEEFRLLSEAVKK